MSLAGGDHGADICDTFEWNLDAEVLEITAKGEVKVSAGVLRTTFGLDELARSQNGGPPRPSGPVPQKTKKIKRESAAAERTTPVRVDSNTLDLRGLRVDESLQQVDAFVAAMLRAGERAAFVLHGHGTGALKQAVRSHLRDSLHVHDSAPAVPEDGGDAPFRSCCPTIPSRQSASSSAERLACWQHDAGGEPLPNAQPAVKYVANATPARIARLGEQGDE